MEPSSRHDDPRQMTLAHVVPFAVFMGFLVLLQLVEPWIQWKHPDAPWWRDDPSQWIYPIQTLVCLGLLIRYRSYYSFRWSWKWGAIGVIFGVIGIGFWLLPTTLYDYWGMTGKNHGWTSWLGVQARRDGFDPGIFHQPVAYWTSLILRFLRAVVVVALIEEIFWRGFLMRFVCDWEGNYWKQPFGRFTWRSYGIVTACFVLAHHPVDWAAAVVFGSMMYALCVWSKSLGSCIIMHATANLLMGVYIMAYGKYGLW